MIVKKKRLEKLCCFYVSEFHLEMILVPYINNVIEKNKKVSILTEIDLEETIKILMSKINLSEKRKKEILDLGWKNNQTPNIEEEMCVIVIGNKKYIEEKGYLEYTTKSEFIRKYNKNPRVYEKK